MYRFVKKGLRGLIWVCTPLILLVGAFLGRLYYAPLSLDPYVPHILGWAQGVFHVKDLSFRELSLGWQGPGHPLSLSARTLRLEVQQNIFQASLVQARLRLRSLLLGRILPSDLFLQDVHAQVVFPDTIKDNQEDAILTFDTLIDLWENEPRLKPFKSLVLENMTLNVERSHGKPFLKLAESFLSLERTKHYLTASSHGKGTFFARGDGTKKARFSWSTNWFNKRATNLWFGHTEIKDLPLQSLLSLGPQSLPLTFDPQAILNMNFDMTYDGFWKNALEASLGPSQIIIDHDAASLPQDIFRIKKGVLKAFYHRGNLTIPHLDFDLSQGSIKLQATAQPKDSEKNRNPLTPLVYPYEIHLGCQLRDFPMALLKDYWPQNLAPHVRTWLINSITQGNVPLGHMGVRLDWNGATLSLEDLKAFVDLKKADLMYLKGIPLVKGLDAKAVLTPKSIVIHVQQGQQEDQKIRDATVRLSDLDDTPRLSIHAPVEGNMENALKLLQNPALDVLSKDFFLQPVKGTHRTLLTLEMPLKDSLMTEDIQVQSHSDLSLQEAKVMLMSKVFKPKNITGSLDVRQNQVTFQSKGTLKGAPFDLQGKAHGIGKQTLFNVHLKSDLTASLLKMFWPSAKDYYKGNAPFDLRIQNNKGDALDVHIDCHLTPASMVFGDWKKQAGEKAALSSHIHVTPGQETAEVKALTLQGRDLDFMVQGLWKKGDLARLCLKKGRLGATNVTGTLTPHQVMKDWLYGVFQGSMLDLTPLMAQKESKEAPPSHGISLEIHGKMDAVRIGQKQTLHHVTSRIIVDKGDLYNVQMTGYADAQKSVFFQGALRPHDVHTRNIVFQTPYAGKFLKAMGLVDNLQGGRLFLEAFQKIQKKPAPWKGKIRLKKFKVKKVPILGRLLTLAFPTGFAGFLQDGDKLAFDQLKLSFEATPEKILIQDGRAYGNSLGFSVFGLFNLSKEKIKLSGSIIPAYFVNTLLAKFPLLGQALTGGKHEGLFAVAYKVSGPLSEPSIFVNPLSAFTPGFLRRLFTGVDPKGEQESETPESLENHP